MKIEKKVIVCLSAASAVLLLTVSFFAAAFAIKNSQMNDRVQAFNSENTDLKEKISELKQTVGELKDELNDGGKAYSEKISSLESSLKEQSDTEKRLRDELEKYKSRKKLDFTEIKDLTDSIENYIESGSPLVRIELDEEELEILKQSNPEAKITDHRWEKTDKYKTEAVGKLGERYRDDMTLDEILSEAESKASAPRIAVYYESISDGYVYTYNGDEIFDSASVMKAPYICAVLQACTDYKEGKIKPDADDERYSAEKLAEMFDLDKTVILDHATMDRDGSGVLKDEKDGTEYTYRELAELALEKSDNIAFSQIKKNFTNKWYYDFAAGFGVKSPLGYEMNMTVREAGKMFAGIYYFTNENKEFGEFLKQAMEKSSHTVLSKSVFGTDCIHKYGWDENAYHDAAVIYGERPYIAVVFTDIDSGGSEADQFIRTIFRKIQDFHNSLA